MSKMNELREQQSQWGGVRSSLAIPIAQENALFKDIRRFGQYVGDLVCSSNLSGMSHECMIKN